jgi:hypothetical protein
LMSWACREIVTSRSPIIASSVFVVIAGSSGGFVVVIVLLRVWLFLHV